MPVDQILFSSVSQERNSKKNTSLLRDSAQFVVRSKGIQKIFEVGACAFSWALFAPLKSEARPFLEQGRCISVVSKSAFGVPELAMQGYQMWTRGDRVKDQTAAVANSLKTEPLERPLLRKIAIVAKDAFAWGSSLVSWGCRVLGLVNKEVLEHVSVELPNQIARVGVNAALTSSLISVFDKSVELGISLQAKEPENRFLKQMRSFDLYNLKCETASLFVRFVSLALTAVRVCALYPIMPIIALVASTASLGFRLAGSTTQYPIQIQPRRASLIT